MIVLKAAAFFCLNMYTYTWWLVLIQQLPSRLLPFIIVTMNRRISQQKNYVQNYVQDCLLGAFGDHISQLVATICKIIVHYFPVVWPMIKTQSGRRVGKPHMLGQGLHSYFRFDFIFPLRYRTVLHSEYWISEQPMVLKQNV